MSFFLTNIYLLKGANYNLSDYFDYGPQPEPEPEPQPEPELDFSNLMAKTPVLRKDTSELPTDGSGAIYNFDYSDSLTILIKAKIPDNYVHTIRDASIVDFLFTLRPHPDPYLGWGGGKYAYLEWRGPAEYNGYVTQPGDADQYALLS